jgi:arylsulfatase A-like enzyme
MGYQIRLLSLVIVVAVCFRAMAASTERAQDSPNIIFIMSDDHAAHAIGAYGGRLADLDLTPNLDRLAARGIRFENAFCNNSICTPSRASIITGQYPQTNGVLDLDIRLDPQKQYLPNELRRFGYSTAVIGKWHLHIEPTAFDYYKVLPGQGKYFDPTFHEKGKGQWPNNKVQTEGHSTDVITDLSIEYIRGLDKSRPFFLMHHYKAPHDFFECAPRYDEFLAKTEIPEPASLYYQPTWGSAGTRGEKGSLEHYIGTSISDRHIYRNYNEFFHEGKYEGQESAHQGYQTYLKAYLRCVKGIDDNLGRFFDFLKTEGLWENTVIIYTGDQGMMLGEHDLQDKRWMYEESMRMPFIVHYPRMIQPGTVTDLLINNTDFAPTMIELAGGHTPDYMQGRSFVNTLRGREETDWRTATYYRYWMHIQAMSATSSRRDLLITMGSAAGGLLVGPLFPTHLLGGGASGRIRWQRWSPAALFESVACDGELLVWVRVLAAAGNVSETDLRETDLSQLPYLGALLKNRQDLQGDQG